MKRISVLLLLVSTAQLALASGFGLYEGSTRGVVLGGLTAGADDPSVLFYNPAGMTNLEGTQFMGGGVLIAPTSELTVTDIYSGATTNPEMEKNIFTPPHIYITHQLNDKLWVGGAVYTRFGLGTEFDADWVGRYSNTETVIQTVSFGGSVAYKVNDNVSIGASVYGMWLDAELNQVIDSNRFQLNPPHNPATTEFDALQTIAGDNISYGFDLSAHFRMDDWSFGILYVGKVEHDLDGTARYDRPTAAVPFTWFNDTNVTAETIELPDMLFLGASHRATEKISYTFGAIRTGWSSIESLIFNYENPFAIIPAIGELDRAERELDWEDVWRYYVGGEYVYNEDWTLMGGFTFDESPLIEETVSFLLPTHDRKLFSIGATWQRDVWRLSAAYTYLVMSTRDLPDRQVLEGVLPSTSDGKANFLSFSASRRF